MIEQGIVKALHEARANKDPKAIAQAEALASVLKAVKLDGFQDTPFPQTPKETTPIEVRRFSDETRAALEKQGYVIDTLTGQSIASLRQAGRKFWSTWHNDYPQFEALTSIRSEVAINPPQLFIPKSNNKTLAQQEEMINRFSQELGNKVPGVEAIMGSVADYVDLAFTYLGTKGKYLFGEKYDYNFARTNTPTVDTRVACVGDFAPVGGLSVTGWGRSRGGDSVFAAPLVVPKT